MSEVFAFSLSSPQELLSSETEETASKKEERSIACRKEGGSNSIDVRKRRRRVKRKKEWGRPRRSSCHGLRKGDLNSLPPGLLQTPVTWSYEIYAYVDGQTSRDWLRRRLLNVKRASKEGRRATRLRDVLCPPDISKKNALSYSTAAPHVVVEKAYISFVYAHVCQCMCVCM